MDSHRDINVMDMIQIRMYQKLEGLCMKRTEAEITESGAKEALLGTKKKVEVLGTKKYMNYKKMKATYVMRGELQ